jgi:Uma2 family endonuclease
MPLPKSENYTIDYIYSLPEGQRAELIDGVVFDMAAPNTIHQRISSRLSRAIGNFIDEHKGECEVFTAPFAVFLNDDDKNYVEPDISVVCDKNKLDERGCNGAPDWIIEIISSSTSRMDYGIKLFKYRTCGVKEYWIVNPLKKTVNVFDFANDDEKSGVYIFDDKIASCTYPNLEVRISDCF